MHPDGVLESALYCDDLDAAQRFYQEILGLAVISRDPERHVFFRCGEGVVLVFRPERTESVETRVGGAPIPRHGARGPGHLAFRVEDDERDAWHRHLLDHGVSIESQVEWPGGGWSLYFRDPAGNSLELATASIWGIEIPDDG